MPAAHAWQADEPTVEKVAGAQGNAAKADRPLEAHA
jgi:hypothetical protein